MIVVIFNKPDFEYDVHSLLKEETAIPENIDKASKTIIYDQDNEMISKDSFIQKFS